MYQVILQLDILCKVLFADLSKHGNYKSVRWECPWNEGIVKDSFFIKKCPDVSCLQRSIFCPIDPYLFYLTGQLSTYSFLDRSFGFASFFSKLNKNLY